MMISKRVEDISRRNVGAHHIDGTNDSCLIIGILTLKAQDSKPWILAEPSIIPGWYTCTVFKGATVLSVTSD